MASGDLSDGKFGTAALQADIHHGNTDKNETGDNVACNQS